MVLLVKVRFKLVFEKKILQNIFVCNSCVVSVTKKKMEPLVTNRRCLTWLCICEADKSTNRWKKFAHAIYAVTVVVGCIGAFASSFAYSWKFASIDLGKSLFSLMFVAAEITAIYSALVGMILMRHKIDPIFNSLSTIYRARKYYFSSIEVKSD